MGGKKELVLFMLYAFSSGSMQPQIYH
jgi:hypothetical protein